MSESAARLPGPARALIPNQLGGTVAAVHNSAPRRHYGHHIALGTRGGATLVRLIGDIDLVAEHDVNRVMESLLRLGPLPVEVDLSEVEFIDTTGLRPLIEATRRRRAAGFPPLLVTHCSLPTRRLLNALRMDFEPTLDVDAWDLLGGSLRPSTVAASV